MSLELRARAAAAILELAFNPHQRRDSRGRWVKMPTSELKRPRRTPRRKLLGQLMDGPQDALRGDDLQRVRDMFDFRDGRTGMHTDVLSAQVSRRADGTRRLGVMLAIRDGEGRLVGNASRDFKRDPLTGQTSVEHVSFTLDPAHRDTGFSSKWLRQMEDRYRQLGVGQIELTTSGIGGYAWAKAAFEFADDKAAQTIADLVDLKMSRQPQTPEVSQQLARLIRRASAGGPDRPLPIEFAMLGWEPGAETWPGKRAMVGTHWDGVKQL